MEGAESAVELLGLRARGEDLRAGGVSTGILASQKIANVDVVRPLRIEQ